MGILNIRPAVREGARLVIGLSGVSGSGKTYTALQLAWGLAKGDSSKVGMLDTENKRGSLYSDILVGRDGKVNQFSIGDLYAPFSPARYSQAIKEFQEAGVEVLVIDSASHEWEGEGGCEDIAGSNNDWKKGKREHKRFMHTLLTCDMHIIVCNRAREKVKYNKVNGKTEVEPIGLQPICEKNFMYEMTVSLMIHDQGLRRDILKCPADLQAILGKTDGYLGPKEGHALRKWVDGAKQLAPNIERARNTILSITGEGLSAVNTQWDALGGDIKKALGQEFIDMARSSAEAFDSAKNERDQYSESIDLADGDFNPLAMTERETVGVSMSEDVPLNEVDPFGEDEI